MVLATVHSELAPSQRIDVVVPAVLVSGAALQYFLSGWSFVTVFALFVALGVSLCLVLAPVYSINAYVLFRLSKPLRHHAAIEGNAVVFKQNDKIFYRPLLLRDDGEGRRIPRIEFENRYYEADASLHETKEDGIMEFTLVTSPLNFTIAQYLERVSGKDTRNASRLLAIHGENKFDIPLPELRKLVTEQAQSPFFIFQVFCVTLWMLDEYWYFALFTLIMLIMFEFVVAQNRLRNVEVARQMLRADTDVWVRRAGSWRKVASSQLVPLDVVAVSKDRDNPFPCDALLVSGTCVVNEAMLTGESTPKMKEAVTSDLDLNKSQGLPTTVEDSRFVVLGGTTVLETRGGGEDARILGLTETPEADQAVGVILRTGYETTQGSLMRVILHAGDRVTVDSNREAYAFMFCLIVVATVAASYVLNEGLKDTSRSQWKLFLHCIMIVTSVVPPELPMELSLAVTTSLSNLILKHAVYCTEPYRIPLAGMLDICCFDKTGTLTSDDLSVTDLIDAQGVDVSTNPNVLEVLATCQSLVYMNDAVSGDTTETAAWRVASKHFAIIHDTRLGVSRLRGLRTHYTVLKRFAFDSTVRRMSALCTASFADAPFSSPETRTFVVCKGAPETLREFLTVIPAGYDSTCERLAGEGKRVLALARKDVGVGISLSTMARKDAETGLEFVGFMALDSPLKADSGSTVAQLRASGHRVVIITGDNETTAVEVAKRVGVIESGIDDGRHAINGTQLSTLLSKSDEEIKSTLLACSVFARVSPAQKEAIVARFSDYGLVTLMCGDGTNDAGALKRADVGVSVISNPLMERVAREDATVTVEELMNASSAQVKLGDASIASPFTAKTPHVSAVLDIVRQGRCTLVTTLQMFKILAVNGLVHSITMTVLYLKGVRQGDTQSTLFGVLVAIVFALLSFTQPQDKLTSRRPTARIFSRSVIASIIGQSTIHLAALFGVCALVAIPPDEKIDPDAPFKPNAINTVVYIAGFAIQANVFASNYRGDPFMTPFLSNKPFAYTIGLMHALAALMALGVMPEFLLDILELVPTPGIHASLGAWLAFDTAASQLWEHVIVRALLGG